VWRGGWGVGRWGIWGWGMMEEEEEQKDKGRSG